MWIVQPCMYSRVIVQPCMHSRVPKSVELCDCVIVYTVLVMVLAGVDG